MKTNVIDIDDDGELNNKYRHKKWNAKRYGRVCFLTFKEYVDLVREAGIKSSDIGSCGYHLARYEDRGDYQVGNCRFIPRQANMDERQPPDCAKISRAMKAYYSTNPGSFTGLRHKESSKIAIGEANKISQLGGKNSQFGRCWVYKNGKDKKIDSHDLDAHLGNGWRRGRASSSKFATKTSLLGLA